MGIEFMKHKVATGVVWLVDRSVSEGVIRATAFVAGCSGVATLAYLISFWIGLYTISALIASHEKLSETRSLLNNRILGTVLGIGIAIGIAAGTSQLGATMSTQIALGVALCAIVAREWPSLRVGMWSSSIVVLTAHDSCSMAMTAFDRGSVVILGALIGGSFHWAAEIMVDALTRCTGTLVQGSASIRAMANGHKDQTNAENNHATTVAHHGHNCVELPATVSANCNDIAEAFCCGASV